MQSTNHQIRKCENDIYEMNCWWHPLGSRKNPSPRWDLNPRLSTIHSDALTTEWITKGRGFKPHLGLGFFRLPSGFHQQCENDIYEMNCWWHPLGSRKNPSPRWDLNPRLSTIHSDALTTEWITEGRGFKSHLGLGFFRLPSGFHQQFISYISFSHLLIWWLVGCISDMLKGDCVMQLWAMLSVRVLSICSCVMQLESKTHISPLLATESPVAQW